MAPDYEPLDRPHSELLPTWLAAVPAILIGLLAGLILHALLGSSITHPKSRTPNREAPSLNRHIVNPQALIADPESAILNPRS